MLFVKCQTLLISDFRYGKILLTYKEVTMKNIFKLILALILIYIILITNIADINHGEGLVVLGGII